MTGIKTKSRCLDCVYCYSIAADFFICDHGVTDKKVFNPKGLTECSSWRQRTDERMTW